MPAPFEKKDAMEEAACIDDVRFPSGEFPVHDPFGVVICSLLYTFMLAVCTSCILILDEQIFFFEGCMIDFKCLLEISWSISFFSPHGFPIVSIGGIHTFCWLKHQFSG